MCIINQTPYQINIEINDKIFFMIIYAGLKMAMQILEAKVT